MSEFELMLNVCLLYIEDGLPIPVDSYSEMRAEGIDPCVVEELFERGMNYEEIRRELLEKGEEI